MNKIFIILLSLSLFNIFFGHLVIPFKGNNLSYIYDNSINKNFLENFIMSTFYNQLYTVIGIGIPSQNVILSIIPKQIDFLFNRMNCQSFYSNNYIDKNNLSPNNKTIPINITKIGYIKNESKSFKKNVESASYKNNIYFPGKESLKLDDYRNILTKNYSAKKEIFPYSQLNLVNFSFIYEEININNEDKDQKSSEICGSFGLTFNYGKNNNKLLQQLKSSNITNNYYWSFNYTSLDKGYIIFGSLPHEYNPVEYDIDNLVEAYTIVEEGDIKWAMDLNEIYFFSNKDKKNEKITINSIIAEGVFEFSLQLIIGSYSYKETIEKHFFKEYYDKKICIEEEYNLDIKYSIIRCKTEKFQKNIKGFPSLFLYNRGLQNNFELSYEDLFITEGDYIYFLVIFRKGGLNQSNQTWKLGIPFLKKHQMIFNSDSKRIGCYVKNKINIENIKNEDNNLNTPNKKEKSNKDSIDILNYINNIITLRTFLEIIIVLLFILVLICLGKQIYNLKTKQKKPYELQDEDYDYFSNTLGKKTQKDNNDINNDLKNEKLSGQIIEMKSH